jgi:hypothetical protein
MINPGLAPKIIFGTGHRPDQCDVSEDTMHILALGYLNKKVLDDTIIICGMAAGWDLQLGRAAMESGLKVWAARPWGGHRPNKADEILYDDILSYADVIEDVVLQMDYPGPWCYQLRNQWMVNNGTEGLALWSGVRKGGTFNCLKYAKDVGKPVTNLYPGMEGVIEL